ncbi:MAG: DUF6231 family protein [Psychrobacter sp.]|uniref:DUF6231 family protein n=1 Tax=Psychrobacter sp. TaxID=56811 RepID=UPI002648575F|nr:DUF6231 family protein [Psychrobacter sp.]MDN5621176.1 DUF6231 family protein [Psychrobacter sp.]
MTIHSTKHSKITLPLLIEYVDALMTSLDSSIDKQAQTIDAQDDARLLWVAHDKKERSLLQTALEKQTDTNDKNNASAESWQLSTLSELTKQPVLERYELACFWLPTLSHELLHQYIPALMRYRDLYAAHLLVALDDSIDLKPYGFTPFDILDEPSVNIGDIESITSATVSATLWQFNLYDYKQLPNWLNADYWANPENWGKHRW